MIITLRPLKWVAEPLVNGNKLTKRLADGCAIQGQRGHPERGARRSGDCVDFEPTRAAGGGYG